MAAAVHQRKIYQWSREIPKCIKDIIGKLELTKKKGKKQGCGLVLKKSPLTKLGAKWKVCLFLLFLHIFLRQKVYEKPQKVSMVSISYFEAEKTCMRTQ